MAASFFCLAVIIWVILRKVLSQHFTFPSDQFVDVLQVSRVFLFLADLRIRLTPRVEFTLLDADEEIDSVVARNCLRHDAVSA